MNRNWVKLPAILAVASILAQAGGCCTTVGFGMGTLVDHSKPHGVIPQEMWETLPEGARVDLRREDGSRLTGRLERVRGSSAPGCVIVAVRTDSATVEVPASEIRRLWVKPPYGGRLVGSAVGFTIDLAATIAFIIALESAPVRSWGT